MWETPLGKVRIQEAFAQELKRRVPFMEEDAQAHSREHSLERQVPFLQHRNEGFELVPICLQHLDYSECEALGTGIAQAIRDFPGEVLLVASTDMTHFEPQAAARKKDMLAIERVLEIDPEGLYRTVREHRISMCGCIPTTSVLCACRALGAKKGTLVQYATSGDVSGDHTGVVGYAAVSIA
jgi:AmmeMemoRadiSam system protein B